MNPMDAVIARSSIARLAYEANRTYCHSIGDVSPPQWGCAPQWQRDLCIAEVEFHLNNPFAKPSAIHECWRQDKIDDGWVYGAEADPDAKQHPYMVPFNELPARRQIKDHIFAGLVKALSVFVQEQTA